MNKIDQLIQRAKKTAAVWRPFQYTIRPVGDRFHVLRCLWNGVPGSLRPGEPEKRGINPCAERYFDSEEAALAAVREDIRSFEDEFGVEVSDETVVFNLCPPSDSERKEWWLSGNRTTIEYLADEAGLDVEEYIKREFGPPKFSEEYMREELVRHADVIRWRREEGMDGKETVAAVDTQRSATGTDKDGQ